jgi:hypothetical protein
MFIGSKLDQANTSIKSLGFNMCGDTETKKTQPQMIGGRPLPQNNRYDKYLNGGSGPDTYEALSDYGFESIKKYLVEGTHDAPKEPEPNFDNYFETGLGTSPSSEALKKNPAAALKMLLRAMKGGADPEEAEEADDEAVIEEGDEEEEEDEDEDTEDKTKPNKPKKKAKEEPEEEAEEEGEEEEVVEAEQGFSETSLSKASSDINILPFYSASSSDYSFRQPYVKKRYE